MDFTSLRCHTFHDHTLIRRIASLTNRTDACGAYLLEEMLQSKSGMENLDVEEVRSH